MGVSPLLHAQRTGILATHTLRRIYDIIKYVNAVSLRPPLLVSIYNVCVWGGGGVCEAGWMDTNVYY